LLPSENNVAMLWTQHMTELHAITQAAKLRFDL